jgi:hypothetical protein
MLERVFVRMLDRDFVRRLNCSHRASVSAITCRRSLRKNGSAVTPVHRDWPRAGDAVAADG